MLEREFVWRASWERGSMKVGWDGRLAGGFCSTVVVVVGGRSAGMGVGEVGGGCCVVGGGVGGGGGGGVGVGGGRGGLAEGVGDGFEELLGLFLGGEEACARMPVPLEFSHYDDAPKIE